MVALTIGAVDDLAGHQRRHGGKGIQQPAVQGCLLTGQQRREFLPRHRQRVTLILSGRQMVEQPRQHLPFLRHLQIHTPQAVQNTPLFVAQYQVGVTAQRLQNQSKTALLAQFVGGLDMQRHHTL